MRERQRTILATLAQGPRGARHFTHGPSTEHISANTVMLYIDQLEASGYIELKGPLYYITLAGREVLAVEMPHVQSRIYGNASTEPGSYRSPKWPTREDSEIHRNLPSRGTT